MKVTLAAVALSLLACAQQINASRDDGLVSATIVSVRWNILTPVPISAETLENVQPKPDRDDQRIVITNSDFMEKLATYRAGLHPLDPGQPMSSDFRIVVLLAYRGGSTTRIAIPRSCRAIVVDGQPMRFDRALFDLISSQLAISHRQALGGDCVAK
jgi:hypothetical protein